MISKIDWISFTVSMEGKGTVSLDNLWDVVSVYWRKNATVSHDLLVVNRDLQPMRARAPYSRALQSADGGTTIFAHPDREEFLVELSGKGCAFVSNAGMMTQLLREVRSRCTRIDIASDILTDIEPEMFVSDRAVLRTKSHSEFVSGSGATCYVGSRKSDRYARCYRYFPPHPRSHLLRIEHVLKAEQAREAILHICQTSVEVIVAELGNTFGWQHEVWRPEEITDEKLAAWRPERRNASTVAWMYNQCFPALARLLKDGTLTLGDVHEAMNKLEIDIGAL